LVFGNERSDQIQELEIDQFLGRHRGAIPIPGLNIDKRPVKGHAPPGVPQLCGKGERGSAGKNRPVEGKKTFGRDYVPKKRKNEKAQKPKALSIVQGGRLRNNCNM